MTEVIGKESIYLAAITDIADIICDCNGFADGIAEKTYLIRDNSPVPPSDSVCEEIVLPPHASTDLGEALARLQDDAERLSARLSHLGSNIIT